MPISDSLKPLLDPVYAHWLEASNPPLPAGFTPTLDQMREGFAKQVELSNGDNSTELLIEDHAVESRNGDSIKLRFYRPNNAPSVSAAICFIHGGGWVLGNLDTHDGICNDLALRTGQTVIAVDYRLSPEHAFPAAVHDTIDTLLALQDNAERFGINPSNIAIMGDSAGSSLAVAASLQLRGQAAQPARLALIYPALGADIDRPSFQENANVPGLSPDLMRFFFTSYIAGEQLPDAMAAPLLVEDLSGLPPVYISAAQFDPLRDDATDFKHRLDEINSPAQLRIEKGLGHGYLWVRRQSPAAADAFTAVVVFLSEGRH